MERNNSALKAANGGNRRSQVLNRHFTQDPDQHRNKNLLTPNKMGGGKMELNGAHGHKANKLSYSDHNQADADPGVDMRDWALPRPVPWTPAASCN